MQKKKLHIQAKNDTILYFVFPRLKYVFLLLYTTDNIATK